MAGMFFSRDSTLPRRSCHRLIESEEESERGLRANNWNGEYFLHRMERILSVQKGRHLEQRRYRIKDEL